jgi:N-acetylmuramoyl-L-alanine amidase
MRRERASPNHDARTVAIDLIVLHYTGMQDGDTALRRLTDNEPRAGDYPGPWQAPDVAPDGLLPRVSAHYVVDESGAVWVLVDEARRAWHAGQSRWEGRKDTNDRSIGIEIVNGGHDSGLPPFTEVQIDGVVDLLADICARRGLGPDRIVGHSDVAPARKRDPGEHFPWARLAEAGFGLWPRAAPALDGRVLEGAEALSDLRARLIRFGYGVDLTGDPLADLRTVVAAFQRRFRPRRIDGIADAETSAILDDLLARWAEARNA